jgi:hypothetical protein
LDWIILFWFNIIQNFFIIFFMRGNKLCEEKLELRDLEGKELY